MADIPPNPEGTPDAAAGPASTEGAADTRIVIKKYANRRLYNTGSSSYVTLEHLAEMVKQGVDFVVYDARTNEDITRQVLTQIIFEAENSGQNLLPIQFLRQLIRMYGDQVQAFVPSYLEMSLDAFARQGDALREQFGGALSPAGLTPAGLATAGLGSGGMGPGGMGPGVLGAGGFPGADPYRLFQDQVRQNMALFDRAMKMFTPFGYPAASEPAPTAKPPPHPSAAPPDPKDRALEEMRARLDEMQRQIARLAPPD